MKYFNYCILATVLLIGTSCVGATRNEIALDDNYVGVNDVYAPSCKNVQGLLEVLNEVVSNERKETGIIGKWHLQKVYFDCVDNGESSRGWFKLSDDETKQIRLMLLKSESNALLEEKEENSLAGQSLIIANYIYEMCGSIGHDVSSVTNIKVTWRAWHEGTSYNGTVYLKNDGSVRNRRYGIL